jgi:hypothetical protein
MLLAVLEGMREVLMAAIFISLPLMVEVLVCESRQNRAG